MMWLWSVWTSFLSTEQLLYVEILLRVGLNLPAGFPSTCGHLSGCAVICVQCWHDLWSIQNFVWIHLLNSFLEPGEPADHMGLKRRKQNDYFHSAKAISLGEAVLVSGDILTANQLSAIVTRAENTPSLLPLNRNVDLSTPRLSSICSPACQPLSPTSRISGVTVRLARLRLIGQWIWSWAMWTDAALLTFGSLPVIGAPRTSAPWHCHSASVHTSTQVLT